MKTYETEDGKFLDLFTNPDYPAYDAELSSEIRALRPDWWENYQETSAEEIREVHEETQREFEVWSQKQQLLELARSGAPAPKGFKALLRKNSKKDVAAN
jgi:hypothetical protein